MKNKGFTLIELLAVIVILALIALVTIPMINNVIEKAKKGALEDSVYGLKSAAELYYSTTGTSETIEFICDGTGCKDGDKKLPFKGTVNLGRVKLFSDGKVSICIEDSGYASHMMVKDKKATTTTGSCNYLEEEYAITELVSANEYKKVKQDYTDVKDALYNKTLISSKGLSKENIISEINNIDLNESEAENKKGIVDALKYSGLGITDDMSWEEINQILSNKFPEVVNLDLSSLECTKSANTGGTTTITQSANSIVFSGSGLNSPAAVFHSFKCIIPDLLNYSRIKINYNVSGNIQGTSTNNIYLSRIAVGGYYVEQKDNGTYIIDISTNEFLNNSIELSFHTANASYTTKVTITGITLYA